MSANETAPTRPAGGRKWMKLDNAANIYPAAMSRAWMAIFRVSATLREPIEPQLLQRAVDETLPRFPTLSQRLSRGLFWHYFEPIDTALSIQPDVGNPCVRMDLRQNNGYMLRVRYHECRIAVEFFHALTDGFGGTTFLCTLVSRYLKLKYGDDIPVGGYVLDCFEPPKKSESADSFSKFARGMARSRKELPAYVIPGTDVEHFLHVTTGIIDTSEALALSKKYSCTLTELLASTLILAIDDIQLHSHPNRRRHKAIKISVPINLRAYYKTDTLRNFSSFINPGIEPKYGQYSLEETIKQVRGFMTRETDEKLINARFTANVQAERNRLLRVMPLFIKKQAMRASFYINGDRQSSSTLTNLGNISLPGGMLERIDRMDLMLGPLKYNRVACAVLSCNGKLVINFSRKIMESSVEKNFFTRLVKLGLHVKIESNQRW